MTNGEKFKEIFSVTQVDNCDLNVYAWLPNHDAIEIPLEWWNAEYKEPKTGHWIEHPEIETSTPEYLMFYECSECGDKQCFCKSDIHKKHFCNNCGAKMVEPQESEDMK